MIDPQTGLVIGATSCKGGVLTYHYDASTDDIKGCWFCGHPIAQMPDIVAAVRADIEREKSRTH